jgi:energy-coupling factor transport system ATP-binding protein
MAQIEIKNLTFSYPDMQTGEYSSHPALSDISLNICKGEFVVVCGKTGCGKSTLLRNLKPAICPKGKIRGSVFFEGVNINDLTERDQAETIGFVMQNPDHQIVTDKVWHELAFGLENLGYSSEEIRLKSAETAEYFELTDLYFSDTDKLSGGQKQILNLASIMTMQPSVLILDEPTSQLDPIATEKFINMLKKINEDFGITIIMSEHRLSYVLEATDRLLVMDCGQVISQGTPKFVAETISDKQLEKLLPIPARIYKKSFGNGGIPISVKQGRSWIATLCKEQGKIVKEHAEVEICQEQDMLSCKNAWFRYEKKGRDIIKGLNLSVKKGEIFAILGGNGTGKTTAMWMLCGVKKPYRGKIKAGGKTALLPQNVQNLFSADTVAEELKGCPQQFIKEMELEDLMYHHPYDISGGQQQKVALAKVLTENPDILLLDEPTKSIDEIYKENLGELLKRLSSKGKTIIMVSHDLDFCGEYADRCGLFANGNLIAINNTRDFFAKNRFYTTTVSKMACDVLKGAVKMEDVICYIQSLHH